VEPLKYPYRRETRGAEETERQQGKKEDCKGKPVLLFLQRDTLRTGPGLILGVLRRGRFRGTGLCCA
jgi:hypothetical protein